MSNVKIHFVGNFASGDDLEKIRSLEWREGIIACTRHAWVWPLYCQLKMRGMNVSISYELEPDAINLIHCQTARGLLTGSDFRNFFIIGIRADFRPFPYGQFEIVQNKHMEKGRRTFMPHFPQPGLIARSPDREEVVNVCVSGRLQNSINVEKMNDDLQNIGCKFIFKGEGHWQEMDEVDILLGIRSLSTESYHSKPPTKLFNAWLAGIPFIGGYDSAYEQVGVPGENYLRVAAYDELLDAIRRLKSDREFYKKLVVAGQAAGYRYTPDKTTDKWVKFFEKTVTPEYEKWCMGSSHMRFKSAIKSIGFSLDKLIRG